ncbi:general stress protein [Aphanothece hegewaldii]|uniref:general stress protein n=1 Tax=Aphanothece hegewaldii TaxID=1521625 RepID=UPI0015E633D1|nr:general stress protein [Aphanothece hegewaldii]
MQQTSLRAVGTFSSRRDAENALNQLRESGFPMEHVSVLGKNAENDDRLGGASVNDTHSGDAKEGAGVGAVTGTVLGGVTGLLIGLEALLIPGVGPFLAAGTLATTLAGAGIGAAAGGLVGALADLGIPEDEARGYNDRISQGDYLVTVEGTLDEIERAGMIFQNRGIRDWNIYDVSNRRRYDRGIIPDRVNSEI